MYYGKQYFFEWCMLLKSLQQLLFGILSGFFSDEFSPNSPCSIISMLMLQWHAYWEIVFWAKIKSSSLLVFFQYCLQWPWLDTLFLNCWDSLGLEHSGCFELLNQLFNPGDTFCYFSTKNSSKGKRLLESRGCISGGILAKLVLRSLMKPIKVSQDLT